MSNEEIEEYFESLATRFVPIGHTEAAPRFCTFNIEEVVMARLSADLDLSQFCLLLEAPAGALEDNNGDGYYDNQDISFMLIRLAEVKNFAEERHIKSESRRLGSQVLARIIGDGQFIDLDENTIEYMKVGPVFGNCFGYRYTFTASSTVDLSVNPALWND